MTDPSRAPTAPLPGGAQPLLPPAIDHALAYLQRQIAALERSVATLRYEGRWVPVPQPDPGHWDALPTLPAPLVAVPPPIPTPIPTSGLAPVQIPPSSPPAGRGEPRRPEPQKIVGIEAGPFRGLVDLSRFEADLSAVPAVREVEVRRYARGRALIEVALSESSDPATELALVERAGEINIDTDGTVMVEIGAPSPGVAT